MLANIPIDSAGNNNDDFPENTDIRTRGRGTTLITEALREQVHFPGTTGLCHVFLQHTSASLLLWENAVADVRTDLERYMARLVTDGDPIFEHRPKVRMTCRLTSEPCSPVPI